MAGISGKTTHDVSGHDCFRIERIDSGADAVLTKGNFVLLAK
jgi:hypothetical protein